jgi:6-phosphogluconolactonase (cycloisomerase 2 family)
LERVGLIDTGGLGGTVGLAGLAPGTSIPTTDTVGQTSEIVTGSPNDALASQDALLISESGRCLFAVNAGSNTITSFAIRNEGNFLDRAGIYPSGGDFPLSISQRGNVVYVLNGGGEGNIVGFRYSDRLCTLGELTGTTRSLKNADFNPPSLWFSPAQVSITPNGKGVIVTVKGTQAIHYWKLSTLGFPSEEQVINGSHGPVPFSFDFDGNGNLVVGEAFGAGSVVPSPFTGAVSTYSINDDDGTLSLISASVPNSQTATCWLRYSNGVIYTSNNDGPTPSISTFKIDKDGGVTLIESVAADAQEGIDRPVDITLSDDGAFLYVLNTGTLVNGTGTPSISVFKVASGLELVDTHDMGLPANTALPQFEDIQGVFGLAVL